MGAQQKRLERRRHLIGLPGGGQGVSCTYQGCGAKQGEIHTQECKDAWRKTILSYKSGRRS